MTIKEKLYHMVGEKTPEEKIRERVKIIRELVKERSKKTEKDNQGKIEELKNKFSLQELTMANKEGEIIKSNGGKKDFEKIANRTGLLKQINQELPNTKILTLRNNGKNHVIYQEEDRVFFMKTPGTISTPEIQRITQELKDKK